jgi:hypothetical protein
LASCSGTAEINSRIQNSFVTTTYNTEGIIVIKGQILGNFKNIVIDDYLPFTTGTSPTPLFAKASPTKGLW